MSKIKTILGTMTYGLPNPKPNAQLPRVTSLQEITNSLNEFYSHGYNILDTARMYCGGDTETVIFSFFHQFFCLFVSIYFNEFFLF